jgi:hypothetical protein
VAATPPLAVSMASAEEAVTALTHFAVLQGRLAYTVGRSDVDEVQRSHVRAGTFG